MLSDFRQCKTVSALYGDICSMIKTIGRIINQWYTTHIRDQSFLSGNTNFHKAYNVLVMPGVVSLLFGSYCICKLEHGPIVGEEQHSM